MTGNRGRIVLADAEEASRKALGIRLVEHGYRVAQAATDDEALRLVAEEATVVLLADLGIANMEGHGLLARMRTGFPRVAVVLVASPDETPRAIQRLREGADAYVIKPFEPQDLAQLLDGLLGKRGTAEPPLRRHPGHGVIIPGSTMEDIERDAILKTLAACAGSTSKAAAVLRISSRTIQYKLKQYRAEAGDILRGPGGSDRHG